MPQNKLIGLTIEKNEAYSEKVYRLLKKDILSGKIKAGTVTNERTLAEQLHISRTPVHDALQKLKNEGWLVQEGRNKMVRMFTRRHIEEIIKIRSFMDAATMDQIAEASKEGELDFSELHAAIEGLKTAVEHITESQDYTEIFKADINWHIAAARMTNNSLFADMYCTYAELLLRTFFICPEVSSRYIDGHLHITKLMEEGEFAAAKQALLRDDQVWSDRTRSDLDKYLDD